MAAMAVLAVAFVVLAAVPVALTDSEGATTTQTVVKDLTQGENLTAGAWYYVSGTNNAITIANANGANLILKKDVVLTITAGSASVYIGEGLSGTTATVDKGTLVQVEGAEGATIKANAGSGKDYTTDGNLKVVEGAYIGAALYPINTDMGTKTLSDSASLAVKIPKAAEGADLTAKVLTGTITAGSNTVTLNLTQPASNATNATDLTLSEDSSALKIADESKWTGTIAVTSGKLAAATSSVPATASGMYIAGEAQTSTGEVSAPSAEDITLSEAVVQTRIIRAGTTLDSGDGFGSATQTRWVSFSEGAKVIADLTFVFTPVEGQITTMSISSDSPSATSGAAWTGTMTVTDDAVKFITGGDGLAAGVMVLGSENLLAEVSDGNTLYAYGDITTVKGLKVNGSGTSSVTAHLVVCKDTLTITEVLLTQYGDLSIPEGKTLTTKVGTATGDNDVVLTAVASTGTTGLTIVGENANNQFELTGSYTTSSTSSKMVLNGKALIKTDASFGNIEINAEMEIATDVDLTFKGTTKISSSGAGGTVELKGERAVFLGEVTVEKHGKISANWVTIGVNSVVTMSTDDSNPATISNVKASKLDIFGQITGKAASVNGNEAADHIYYAVGSEAKVSSEIFGAYTSSAAYQPYYIIDNAADAELKDIKKIIEDAMNNEGYTRFFLSNTTQVDPTNSGSVELPDGIELYFGTPVADGSPGAGVSIGTPKALKILAPTGDEKAVNVTIPAGTKVYISGGDAIAVGEKNTLIVEGYLYGQTDSTTITGAGTFEMASTGAVNGNVQIQTAKATGYVEDAHIDGKTSGDLSFPLYQKVIIDEGKTLTVSALNTVTVYGTLEILGTLVIEADGSVEFGNSANASQGATVKVTGSIVVKKGASLVLTNGSMSIDGSMTVAGEVLVQGNANNATTLTVKNQMTIESTGVLATSQSYGTVEVASTGVMNINGYMGSATDSAYNYLVIKNSGSIIIDNSSITARSAGCPATIYTASADATVAVDSLMVETTSTKLTVTDSGLQVGKDTKTYVVGPDGTDSNTSYKQTQNSIKIQAPAGTKVVGQILIGEAVKSQKVSTVTMYSNIMTISGSLSNGAKITATEATTADDVTMVIKTQNIGSQTVDSTHKMVGYVQIPSDATLVIAKDVSVTNTGSLKVAGYLDMTASGVSEFKNKNGTAGVIDVSGKIKINGSDIDDDTINAVEFQVKEGTSSSAVTYYVYEPLEQAVVDITDASNTNTDKSLVIRGNISVLKDTTVPKDVKVTFAKSSASVSKLTIGSSSNNTVLMTVAEGGSLTSGNGQVVVKGTLKFDNKTNDSTRNTVADVTISDSAENGSITYTNIYNALSTAKSGETVKVTLSATASDGTTAQFVNLYASITIAEGVTLVVGNNVAPLYLSNGVTLYVNGTLKTEQDIYAEKQFSTEAKNSSVNSEYTSAVIVAGQIQTAQSTVYGDSSAVSSGKDEMSEGAPVYGAYYGIDGYNVISSMEVAQESLAKIIDDTIVVNGPVYAGDLSFTKTSSTAVKTIQVSKTQVAQPKSVSTSKVSSSLTVTSLTIDEVTLSVIGDSTSTGTFTGTVQNDSASVSATAIGTASEFQVIDKDGKLYLSKAADTAKGSALSVDEGIVYAGVDNATSFTYTSSASTKISMKVASDAILETVNATISHLDVAGTVAVDSGETLTVGTQLVVSGTVDIFAGDDSKAKASVSIKDTYIGTTKKGVTGAAAVFSGPVTATGVVVIASGSDVDEDAIDSFGSKKTEYYVEDALWITAYDNGSTATYIDAYKNVTITNGYFSGWNNSKGTATAATTAIGASGYDKVYAGANYEIYQIIIKADQGIGDLYLGGNIMSKGFINGTMDGQTTQYYAYWATVKAGTYEVTCKLANGYSGTAVLKDSAGKTLEGNKLTVSGNEYNLEKITSNYQLSGIEKSGYVQPTEEKDNSGLTVTDYLLIVLVILVVVLAVIVALRLMRS